MTDTELQQATEGQTTASDELFTAEADSPSNSRLEKIVSAAKGIFEKHGVRFKAGRGRPRSDGSPKISDVPLNASSPGQTTVQSAAAAPVAQPVDANIVKRCVSAVFKGAKGVLDRKLWRKAAKASDAKFASELVAETTITDDEIAAFTELTEICLKKYGVGTEYAPEVGLIVILTGIGVRHSAAFRSVEDRTTAANVVPTNEGKS